VRGDAGKPVSWKVGDRVCDRWWPWRVGVVRAVLKTRIRVEFATEAVTYDKAHLQFLQSSEGGGRSPSKFWAWGPGMK